jgi:hypothetical protein
MKSLATLSATNHMKTVTRAAVAGVATIAAVGLAAPASAEPLSGNYTETILDNGGRMSIKNGGFSAWVLTPCGPDCTHIHQIDNPWDADVHLQGNTWSGTLIPGRRTLTFDKDTLAGTDVLTYPEGERGAGVYTMSVQLAKD